MPLDRLPEAGAIGPTDFEDRPDLHLKAPQPRAARQQETSVTQSFTTEFTVEQTPEEASTAIVELVLGGDYSRRIPPQSRGSISASVCEKVH